MVDIRRTLPLILLGFLTLGCQSSPWSGRRTPSEQAASRPSPTQRVEVAKPADAASPAATVPAGPDAQAMQEVIAQLQNLKDLDPAAREQLLADLQKSDPRYWPLMVQQLQATLAYRQQTQHRAMTPGTDAGRIAAPVEVASHLAPQAAAPGVAATGPLLAPTALAATAPAPLPNKSLPTLSAVLASPDAPPAADKALATNPVPNTAAKPVAPPETAKASEEAKVLPASYETAAPSSDDPWHEQVQAAIHALEGKVAASPQSADEVAEHARLRMLYLLAGRRDDALRPIPAAAPSVQDFWAKELYGLATWLDTQHIDNPERRAAESRQHLSEALVSLGNTSSLLVRNMAFATKIDGYGDYRPFLENKFAPGQEVLIYAELENFRSESTATGYATNLSISWQILDSRGQRVASDECKSEEVCRSPRRDFFISYPLFLPERIYSGPHTFQLTVEDLKSQKIGQQSLEFTVVDAPK